MSRGAPSLLDSKLSKPQPSVFNSIDYSTKSNLLYGRPGYSPRNNSIHALGNSNRKKVDPFIAKAPTSNPMNNFDDLKEITVDTFRPENIHILRGEKKSPRVQFAASPSQFQSLNTSPQRLDVMRSLQVPSLPYQDKHFNGVLEHRSIPSMPSPQ